jgi:hypothetical protein
MNEDVYIVYSNNTKRINPPPKKKKKNSVYIEKEGRNVIYDHISDTMPHAP